MPQANPGTLRRRKRAVEPKRRAKVGGSGMGLVKVRSDVVVAAGGKGSALLPIRDAGDRGSKIEVGVDGDEEGVSEGAGKIYGFLPG